MRVLSLGAGVQSSALALMMKHGVVETVDCAVFADTQDESRKTYAYLDWLASELPFPIHRATRGKMSADILADAKPEVRYLLPSFTADGGMGKRQCTRHYKLDVIKRQVRELGASRQAVSTMVIGISYDEAHRMNQADVQYMRNAYPLVELEMTRGHCIEWLSQHGYPIPPKSSCIHCPYRGSKGFKALDQDEFAAVVLLDEFIRNRGAKGGVVQFLHPDRVPLAEADLSQVSDYQTDMFGNECLGMCGV